VRDLEICQLEIWIALTKHQRLRGYCSPLDLSDIERFGMDSILPSPCRGVHINHSSVFSPSLPRRTKQSWEKSPSKRSWPCRALTWCKLCLILEVRVHPLRRMPPFSHRIYLFFYGDGWEWMVRSKSLREQYQAVCFNWMRHFQFPERRVSLQAQQRLRVDTRKLQRGKLGWLS
jgi:hypothetical protein